MKVTSKINIKGLNQINNIAIESLVKTADKIEKVLRTKDKTIPFDTGYLQERSHFVDTSRKKIGVVTLVYDTPYARRLYFHPEFNFQKTKNPNAGAKWFEPYINGNKKTFASKAFARIMRSKMK